MIYTDKTVVLDHFISKVYQQWENGEALVKNRTQGGVLFLWDDNIAIKMYWR